MEPFAISTRNGIDPDAALHGGDYPRARGNALFQGMDQSSPGTGESFLGMDE